jgi:uncharacterized protein (DUF2267 family)
MTDGPQNAMRSEQELLLRVARRPRVCCCCLCLPREDRRRARRVFRLTRRVMRDWRKEQEEARLAAEQGIDRDRP